MSQFAEAVARATEIRGMKMSPSYYSPSSELSFGSSIYPKAPSSDNTNLYIGLGILAGLVLLYFIVDRSAQAKVAKDEGESN